MPTDHVAAILDNLVSPVGAVTVEDHWMPQGLLSPDEATLDQFDEFTRDQTPRSLRNWWLKRPKRANTPNWDLISTCGIDGDEGLVLIETKAHDCELKKEGKPPGNPDNDEQIAAAIEEANRALNAMTPGWALSSRSHYQLSNRLAWAWKLASLGTPTILVYLGFLHATEMACHGQRPFASPVEWEDCFRKHAVKSGIVPNDVFGRALKTTGAPMWTLVRSLDLKWVVTPSSRQAR